MLRFKSISLCSVQARIFYVKQLKNYHELKSSENDLRAVYLIIDLVILNIAMVTVMLFRYLDLHLNTEDPNILLLQGNLSWIITYFVFVKRNLYLRDAYIHRVLRIGKRTLIFFIISSVVAFLTTPHNLSRSFLLEYTFVFFIGELLF